MLLEVTEGIYEVMSEAEKEEVCFNFVSLVYIDTVAPYWVLLYAVTSILFLRNAPDSPSAHEVGSVIATVRASAILTLKVTSFESSCAALIFCVLIFVVIARVPATAKANTAIFVLCIDLTIALL